ncbi:MAG: plastocyanin/azurin family copper-binding protein [Nitrosopumilus sp.]
MKFLLLFSVLVILGSVSVVHAEEYIVEIPFGAYNPELNTPAEVWYDPPIIQINVGDTITWENNDREAHTVTSGEGTGRFEWMSQKQGGFGKPDGIFDSGRFLPNDSWTYKFEKVGTFSYYCIIHPWMEGIVNVGENIPDFPHDASGAKIESFPIIQFTPDQLIEFDLSWEPAVIKTFEKTAFVFQTYDPFTNSNLDKMKYEMIITQNGKEVFRDTGLTQVGGDYRNFIFEESGPIEIRFQNIVSGGTSGIASAAREPVDNPIFRTVVFDTIVYDNQEKSTTSEVVIQPAKRIDIYYEILVAVILVPAIMLLGIVAYMKFGKSNKSSEQSKPGAVKI